MTEQECEELIRAIDYKDWGFETNYSLGEMRLRVEFDADGERQYGRWWLIDLDIATKSDIVQTALKAALTAEEHETREHFYFHKRRLYSPHFDPDALASLAQYRNNLSLPERDY